ncbi:MAG: serine/threonine-protein kinase, partial [Planctomycetota bacterium]|nr:serine/threonine-protein kinase [Planctomycetota bacterium]
KGPMNNTLPTHQSDPLTGLVIDNCVLDRKLGQGSIGISYLATHNELQKPFVIKLLNPTLPNPKDASDRFYGAARSAAELNHENIVTIQNFGHDNGFDFIRMEYVDAVTLEALLRSRKKLAWPRATELVLQIANALIHAHGKEISHGKIRAKTILFSEATNIVKVADFGLAGYDPNPQRILPSSKTNAPEFFMSPVNGGGTNFSNHQDLHGLAETYYFLLSGVNPFEGKNRQEIFLKYFFQTPESPKIYTPDLPQEVCEVLLKSFAKKKAERYKSVQEIAEILKQILATHNGTPKDAASPDLA